MAERSEVGRGRSPPAVSTAYFVSLEYYRLAEKQGGLTIKSLVRKMEQKLNTID